jgi:hypothetical protein
MRGKPPLSGEGLLLHHVIQWWKIDFIQTSIRKYACNTVFQESLPFELYVHRFILNFQTDAILRGKLSYLKIKEIDD